MTETVMKCWACGALYEFFNMMVGDQSVCPKCRAEAKRNTGGGDRWHQYRCSDNINGSSMCLTT